MRDRGGIFLLLLVAVLVLGGCTRGSTSRRPPIHLNPNMDSQPKYRAQTASSFFADGAAMRRPVPGTVARGQLADNATYETGRTAADVFVTDLPVEVTDRLVARGRERYDIYCTPCHGERGDGQGMLQTRSGVRTANLLEERLRAMPVGQLYDTITNGFGLMPGYRYPIPVADRWAIIAYVRALQAEQPAPETGEPQPQQAAEEGTEEPAEGGEA